MPGSLTFVDADGHVLEHPTDLVRYAPPGYEDRIWHVETDADGREWAVMDGQRMPANPLALAGTAGMDEADRIRAKDGGLKYTEVRPAAYHAKARLADMDADGIAVSVLYPTLMLGIQSYPDVDFAVAQCRAYNDWLSDHVGEGEGRLFGVGVLPQQDVEAAAAEIRRGEVLRMVGAFVRPNPTEGWRPLSDPVYDPIWRAASDTGLPLGLHPYLLPDLPGACQGLRLAQPMGGFGDNEDGAAAAMMQLYFMQALANPFDMMTSMAYVLAGGVCERFPDLKVVFLEANGGWVVPWLERLDHHAEIFTWNVPWLKREPSEYFRRQCWISFDPDESTLAFTAANERCGADRIVWASDYPHPDAKFPGVTKELNEAMAGLPADQQELIAGGNARALYGI